MVHIRDYVPRSPRLATIALVLAMISPVLIPGSAFGMDLEAYKRALAAGDPAPLVAMLRADAGRHHMLVAGGNANTLLHASVTAAPEHRMRAVNLAELVLNGAAFDAQPQPDRDETVPARVGSGARKRRRKAQAAEAGRPDWWRIAQELEAADQLERAEQTIQQGAQNIAGAAMVADLYRSRMKRLLETGDKAGAIEAFRKADQWIFFYASQATSGGEGAALSRERDQFRTGLVAALGHDPEATDKS